MDSPPDSLDIAKLKRVALGLDVCAPLSWCACCKLIGMIAGVRHEQFLFDALTLTI